MTTVRPVLLVTVTASRGAVSTRLSDVVEANRLDPSRLGAGSLELVRMIRIDGSLEGNGHLGLNDSVCLTEVLVCRFLFTALDCLDVTINCQLGGLAVENNVESWVWVRNIGPGARPVVIGDHVTRPIDILRSIAGSHVKQNREGGIECALAAVLGECAREVVGSLGGLSKSQIEDIWFGKGAIVGIQRSMGSVSVYHSQFNSWLTMKRIEPSPKADR